MCQRQARRKQCDVFVIVDFFLTSFVGRLLYLC